MGQKTSLYGVHVTMKASRMALRVLAAFLSCFFSLEDFLALLPEPLPLPLPFLLSALAAFTDMAADVAARAEATPPPPTLLDNVVGREGGGPDTAAPALPFDMLLGPANGEGGY